MGLAVPPPAFEMHMRYLKKNGFCVIGLADLARKIKSRLPIPRKSVAIAFDDGYRSILTNALPILKKFEFTATLFVNVYFLERKLPKHVYWHDWQTLNWDDLRKLHEAGISIGSHALTHRSLAGMNTEELIGEIDASRKTIEGKISSEVYAFSFPHGRYTSEAKSILKDRGFLCACSSVNGANDKNADIFALKRTEITAFDDSPLKFEKKILGCYDWLAYLPAFLSTM